MGGTDLIEFAFESAAASGMPPSVFLRMVRQASDFNRRMGLTGCLDLRGGRFSCVIEGRTDVMLPLAGRILADSRHRAIHTIAFHAVGARRFDGWNVVGEVADAVGCTPNLRFLPERRTVNRVAAASIHLFGAGSH